MPLLLFLSAYVYRLVESVGSPLQAACLLQNLQTLILLQQRLQKQQERHQQQPEASAPEAAAAAIAAFVQEMQQFCNNKSCCNSIRGRLIAQLPKKRVYWEQQAKAQHEQLLLQLVDRMLADLELWAEEAPSDDDAAASPVPAQVAGTEQQQRRQRQVVAEERHDILLLEDRRNRELLLPRDSIPMRKEPAAFVASPAAPRAESAVSDNQLEEHLLDTASEMKQGALMFKERLQKDNILLQRTAATQETLQQQQQRGLDAARKLLRVSFFSSLMPLLQLAISLAVTVAMISFILATPGYVVC